MSQEGYYSHYIFFRNGIIFSKVRPLWYCFKGHLYYLTYILHDLLLSILLYYSHSYIKTSKLIDHNKRCNNIHIRLCFTVYCFWYKRILYPLGIFSNNRELTWLKQPHIKITSNIHILWREMSMDYFASVSPSLSLSLSPHPNENRIKTSRVMKFICDMVL